jgi:septal ring factor EnvC (AmiA/AmiB activator)
MLFLDSKTGGHYPTMKAKTAIFSSIILLVLTCLTVRATAPPPSPDDDIKKKQAQLEQLRKEIDKYEKRIKEQEKKEHATLDLLDSYDRQSSLLRKLIAKLKERVSSLQHDIDETRASISDLNGQMSGLKQHYARYVAAVYKYGRTHDLELLLSSKSLNQMLVRAEYLRRFSEQRKQDLERIGSKRDDLEAENLKLQQQLTEQQALMKEKGREESKLAARTKKRQTLLAKIRRDKKNVKQQIERKKQDAKELENIIAKLIEEDRIRKEREKSAEAAPEPVTGASFGAKRGHLRWPVSQGKLEAHFGSHEHPTLHTITQNTGIDIAVPAGTDVEAVADGEVSKIYWLPSFGNLLILYHNGGYRTVYAHLSEITVNEGERVREGTTIGKSGESLSGPLLHFEIYKEREKQDPELWLRPHGLSQR